MSIMGTYGSGGEGRKVKKVQEQMQQSGGAARRLPAASAGRDTDAAAGALVDAAAPEDGATAELPPTSLADGAALAAIVADLERRGEVHAATLRALESTAEWRDYDAHLTFELLLLRHRYQSTDAPLTSARRSQMQAHLRAKQRAVMEAHAERVAKAFVATLTAGERDAFRARFMRLDAVGLELQPHDEDGAMPVDDATMRAAFDDLQAQLGDPGVRAGLAAAARDAAAAADAAAPPGADGATAGRDASGGGAAPR